MNIYPKKVTASDLKNKTSEILNLVAYGGYEVIIERHGEEIVKVSPIKKGVVNKNYKKTLAKYLGSIPDFPDVTKFRRSRKYVKMFD